MGGGETFVSKGRGVRRLEGFGIRNQHFLSVRIYLFNVRSGNKATLDNGGLVISGNSSATG